MTLKRQKLRPRCKEAQEKGETLGELLLISKEAIGNDEVKNINILKNSYFSKDSLDFELMVCACPHKLLYQSIEMIMALNVLKSQINTLQYWHIRPIQKTTKLRFSSLLLSLAIN